jgi:uncharacterized protein YaaQ
MKMVMAIIPRDEAPRVLDALVAAGHTATFGDSRGGVLRQAYQTLFIGIEEESLNGVLTLIRENCRSRLSYQDATASDRFGLPQRSETVVGGAVIFVWTVDHFEAVQSHSDPGSGGSGGLGAP